MKKLLTVFAALGLAFSVFTTPILAQGSTPDPAASNTTSSATTTAPDTYRGIIPASKKPTTEINCNSATDLGEKIHCGTVTLNDFPLLIIYLIQWVLTIAGGIAVIMIMIGGFQYMLGGVTDDKERGKKTLIYAISGLVVAFMAWWIVELIQVWLTS